MISTRHYDSPLGKILIAADEVGVSGLWLEGQKYARDRLPSTCMKNDSPFLTQAVQWLDIYFSGRQPDFMPPLHPVGSPFRRAVWDILLTIPYGKTITYGEIAKQIAKEKGMERMSAQAIGGAVGHNEISVIIPCHRVVGANGNLTGYAGGIDKKIALLRLEGVDMRNFFVPKRGTHTP